jgi:galactose mutarotase-like enzyme
VPDVLRASMDGRIRGMQTVVLENDVVRLLALAGKGSDIIELVYKPKNIDLLWHAPPGLRSPSECGRLLMASDTGFLDYYGGGWQDLLPTIGSGPTKLHGATFGLHGETGVLPWYAEVHTEGAVAVASLSVTGVRYPYRLEKTIALDGNEIRINERLINTSKQTLEYYWLQHPSFGEPFLEPGCLIELPPESVVTNIASINSNGRVADGQFTWPNVRAKDGSTIDLSVIPSKKVLAEESTFIRVKQGWYNLTNLTLGLRLRFEWDVSTFPWVWFWQNYWTPDYPYYGSAWNVAIEPATSLPTILGEQAAKDALILKGGQSRTTEIKVTISAT